MPNKKSSGQFVKDAIDESLLEIGMDKIYKVSFTTQEEFTTRDRDIEGNFKTEQRFVKAEVNLGHESLMKIIKLINPKRIHWEMGEPPTKEAKEKFGIKARWTWSPYDMNQLRLTASTKT
jgi:hypothetical protein